MKNYKNSVSNYLIIVEGQELELNLFESLFTALYSDAKITKFVNETEISNDCLEVASSTCNKHFIIVKPKHNSLPDILKDAKDDPELIEPYRYFINSDIIDYEFKFVFYVFDIDYATRQQLIDAFAVFNDPTDRGLLLVSSPSIEAVTDFISIDFKLIKNKNERISNTYKPFVQKQVQKISNVGTSEFIRSNLFTLFRYSLKKNDVIFKSTDFIETYYKFKNDVSLYPLNDEEKIIYPICTSFIYMIVGLLFKLDNKPNSSEELDSILKSFSFNDKNADSIISSTIFLRKKRLKNRLAYANDSN